MAIDTSRLRALLLTTGIQQKDSAMYQFLTQLLSTIAQVNDSVNGISNTITNTETITSIQAQFINLLESSESDSISIPGPSGTNGVIGSNGIDGQRGSSGDDGLDGDISFIPGPQGNIGSTGSQGPQGVSFLPEDGLDGETFVIRGADGIAGSNGIQGSPGINILVSDGLDADMLPVIPGPQGPKGNDGIIGSNGITVIFDNWLEPDVILVPGAQGPTGNIGATGPAGSSSGGVSSDSNEYTDIIAGPPGIDGNGTPGTIPKFINNKLLGDSVIIESSGNIGFPKTPTDDLTIEKTTVGYVKSRIRNNDTGVSSYAMYGLNASGNSWGLRMGSTAANSNQLDFVLDAFGTPVIKLSLDTTGNVIIPAGNFTISAGVLALTTATTTPATFNTNNNGSVEVAVANTNVGNVALARFRATSDTTSVLIDAQSSVFTGTGIRQANRGVLISNGAAGLGIGASNAAGIVDIYAGGTTSAFRWVSIGITGDTTFLGVGTLTVGQGTITLNNAAGVTLDQTTAGQSLNFNTTATGGINLKANNIAQLSIDVNGINCIKDILIDRGLLFNTPTTSLLTYDGATKNNNVTIGTNTRVSYSSSGVATGAALVTGFVAATDGKVIIVQNNELNNIISLILEDASSTAANRIAGTPASTRVIEVRKSQTLVYDSTLSRWIIVN